MITLNITNNWKEVCIDPFIEDYYIGASETDSVVSDSEHVVSDSEPVVSEPVVSDSEPVVSDSEPSLEEELIVGTQQNVASNNWQEPPRLPELFQPEFPEVEQNVEETVQNELRNVYLEPTHVQQVNAHERCTYPEISQKEKLIKLSSLVDMINSNNLIEKACNVKEKDIEFCKTINKMEELCNSLLQSTNNFAVV